MEKIGIENREFDGYKIQFAKSALLLIRAEKGVLGCGYFNIAAADKLNEAVAVVTGVGSFDDMLAAEVRQVSAAAAALGIAAGMTGREALFKLS